MAARQQMRDGVRGGAVVVDADIGHGHGGVEFAAGHPWQADGFMRQGVLHRVRVEADGAIGAVHAQQVEIRALAARIGARVAQQHEIAVFARHRIDAAHDLRIERVAHVGHHGQQHAALGRAQAARQVVHAVAERRHGREHLVARGRPHPGLLVHHARDGGHRHPRMRGDGADGDGFYRQRRRDGWRHGWFHINVIDYIYRPVARPMQTLSMLRCAKNVQKPARCGPLDAAISGAARRSSARQNHRLADQGVLISSSRKTFRDCRQE